MKRLVIAVAAMTMAACSGASAGGPVASPAAERPTTASGTLVNQDIGRVDVRSWQRAMEKILISRYKFSLRRREEQFQSIYYETNWILRPPTEEEQQRGILDTRHRVVINGRHVGGGSGGLTGSSVMYSVSVKVEHQIRERNVSEWHAGAVFGGTLEEDMQRMASDLRLEVRAGRSR